MYRKQLSILSACLLVMTMSVTAFAEESQDTVISVTDNPAISEPVDDTTGSGIRQYLTQEEKLMPADVKTVNENGMTLLIKTYEVAPDYPVDRLIEEDFTQNGFRFTKREVLRLEERYAKQTKRASKMVTVEHNSKEGVLARFNPLLDYEENGFSGQLELDPNAIVTEATGSKSYTYTVTDTREYTGFSRNDTYGIPKTVTKNGVTLTLSDVQWQGMGAAQVDGMALSSTYTAIASYSGSATGNKTDGYVSTGIYKGTVEKQTLQSVVYAVVYEGTAIPLPPIPVNYIPFILAVLLLLAAAGITVLWAYRRNARIYAYNPDEDKSKYFLIRKVRVDYNNPVVDLSNLEYASPANHFYIVIDRYAARRLHGRIIKITRRGMNPIEHYLNHDKSRNEYEIQVTYSAHTEEVSPLQPDEFDGCMPDVSPDFAPEPATV